MSERVPPLGTLRDRVQLQRRDQIVGDAGGLETTYFPLATLWARVRAMSPALVNYAGGAAARMSHTAVLRYRNDVSPGDRLIYRGKPLDVLSAEDLNGRRAYLVCRCAEFQQAG